MKRKSSVILVAALLSLLCDCTGADRVWRLANKDLLSRCCQGKYEGSPNDSTLGCGLHLGVEPLVVTFDHIYYSPSNRNVLILGNVVDIGESAFQGVNIAIGAIGECEEDNDGTSTKLYLKSKTKTNSCGTFSIEATLDRGDKLIASFFTYTASIYSLDSLLTR